VKEIFPEEVPATLKIHLDGKIDHRWIKQDQSDPVFLMNVTMRNHALGLTPNSLRRAAAYTRRSRLSALDHAGRSLARTSGSVMTMKFPRLQAAA
jgi:hypothetical protein